MEKFYLIKELENASKERIVDSLDFVWCFKEAQPGNSITKQIRNFFKIVSISRRIFGLVDYILVIGIKQDYLYKK